MIKIKGKSGATWLVDSKEIICYDPANLSGVDRRSFELDNGTRIVLAGHWHSNEQSLMEDTGYSKERYVLDIMGGVREMYRKCPDNAESTENFLKAIL